MELTIVEQPIASPQAVLTLSGRLDALTAPDLKAHLKRLAGEECTLLVVDLTGVSFIDSSGLSALVAGLKAVRQAGGTLRLAGINEQARIAFRLTLLDSVFEFFPDTQTALDAAPAARDGK